MTKLRVLVVEDSITVRKRLCEVLAQDPELEVVGEAGNGKLAIDLCRTLRPDVLTMDMMLPRMTGLAATEHIMAYFPTPILIISSSFNRGELLRTYDALAAGQRHGRRAARLAVSGVRAGAHGPAYQRTLWHGVR
jgi:two-component system chemotaxis response regulator CheB